MNIKLSLVKVVLKLRNPNRHGGALQALLQLCRAQERDCTGETLAPPMHGIPLVKC